MGAVFVIRQRGVTTRFYGEHMEDVALAVFARGPGYATHIVRDLTSITGPQAAGAGFVIDHDALRAVVLDSGVCFDADDARVNGWVLGTASRLASLDRLDLYEEEAIALAEVMRQGDTWARWVDALQRAPIEDSWKGWTIDIATAASFAAEADSSAADVSKSPKPKDAGKAPGYFPADVFFVGPAGAGRAATAEKWMRDWYSALLRGAGEPILHGSLDRATSAVRLLIAPAFTPERICRITHCDNAVSLDVWSEPPASALRSKPAATRRLPRSLRANTWRKLTALLAPFWDCPTYESAGGQDGEQWVIEAVVAGRYHVAHRWCPESGDFWELGRYLERFGAWKQA